MHAAGGSWARKELGGGGECQARAKTLAFHVSFYGLWNILLGGFEV